jgi:hypothetical protein
VREQVLSALTTTVSGKYGTPSPDYEGDVPLTVVQDAADESSNSYDSIVNVMPVAIGRVVLATSVDKSVQRAQAHEVLASLIQLVFADDTLGGLADGIDYTGGSISVELGKFVFAEIAVRVRYHHLRGDPYHRDEDELVVPPGP